MQQTESIPNISCGKTSQVPLQATKGPTSGRSSKRSATLDQAGLIQFLNLTSGQGQDASWATVTALPGASWTLNTGESPKDAVESSLSDVLETGGVPEKYFLSARACQGILNRASRRGKGLPERLYHALCMQITRMTAGSPSAVESAKLSPDEWEQEEETLL